MENQSIDTQDIETATAIHHKNELGLPLLALSLSLVPFLFFLFPSIGLGFLARYVFLIVILSPISGFLIGFVSLNRGKARIGSAGKIISIIAIIIPLSLVALVFAFFIGAATGVISLM